MEPKPVQTWRRHVLTVFIIFHLIAMTASVSKKTVVGKLLRKGTVHYERLLGVWQAWGMFGPNPPNGSSYLVATGILQSGDEIEVPVLAGQADRETFKWFYSRSLKLERSAFVPSKNRALREGYGQWICRQAAADGLSLERVEIWKRRVLHRSQEQRLSGEEWSPEVQRVDLQSIRCEGSSE
jgi:hypothetical protein